MPNLNIINPDLSTDDIYRRLISQLPNWFGTDHPILDVTLQGYLTTNAFNYSQLIYVNKQLRLQTAFGDGLDSFAKDYFGSSLPRRVGENDDSYRNRIFVNLLNEKATLRGMKTALFNLTGNEPVIFEPAVSSNIGGYNVANSPYSLAYGTHGIYGSGSYAYQCFIDVFVSAYQGYANRSGYNDFYFGYNATGVNALGWYAGASLETTTVTDEDIYQTINRTKCEGTICWVRINRI